jgi:hypothetical protein
VVSELPSWMTPERIDEIKRNLEARIAWHVRNNRYGNMSPYLAHSLEVMCGADLQMASRRLHAGESIETLLDENAPIDEAGLARLRGEVRYLYGRLDAATDPSEITVAAIHMFGATLSVIEQCLLRT